MNGKEKCKLLKQIRKEIAESNGIIYLTSECTYEGECRGTCPKCDAEIRYLDAEIQRKVQKGEEITIGGISLRSYFAQTDSENEESFWNEENQKEGGTCGGITTEELDLSVRSYNCLKRAGINTLDDLINLTEDDLLKVRNLGRRSACEVVRKLIEFGCELKAYRTEDSLLHDIGFM